MNKIKSSINDFSNFELDKKQSILIKGGNTSISGGNNTGNQETPSGGSGVGGTLGDDEPLPVITGS
ncbi:MAG: hypothetical protein QM535_10200 [Limnohabitans sp.]|nr:hypothetical protein [Limnohabitans sp.]